MKSFLYLTKKIPTLINVLYLFKGMKAKLNFSQPIAFDIVVL